MTPPLLRVSLASIIRDFLPFSRFHQYLLLLIMTYISCLRCSPVDADGAAACCRASNAMHDMAGTSFVP